MTNLRDLIDQVAAVGVTVTRDGDRVIARGPREAASIVTEILDRKTEVIELLTCCGTHMPNARGGALVLACQLCPKSVTYWRASSDAPMVCDGCHVPAVDVEDIGHRDGCERNGRHMHHVSTPIESCIFYREWRGIA